MTKRIFPEVPVSERNPDHTEIAREAARETVRQMFRELGYDTEDVNSIREFQRDLAWVRDARNKGEQAGQVIRKAGIWGLVGAVLWALWEGVKVAIRAKGIGG